jgi:hypothetical protein
MTQMIFAGKCVPRRILRQVMGETASAEPLRAAVGSVAQTTAYSSDTVPVFAYT